MVWISSMNRMILPAALTSLSRPLTRCSNWPRKLGAGHEAGQIQQEDLLILQTHRDIALGDALRDALGNGRLADAASPMRQGLFFWRRLKIWMVR